MTLQDKTWFRGICPFLAALLVFIGANGISAQDADESPVARVAGISESENDIPDPPDAELRLEEFGEESAEEVDEEPLPFPPPMLSQQPDYRFRAQGVLDPVRDRYPLNRPVRYILTVSWNGRPDELIVGVPGILELDNLEMTREVEIKRRQTEDGVVHQVRIYRLRPISEGPARIQGFSVRARTRTEQDLAPLRISAEELEIGPPRAGWIRRILLGLLGLVLLVVLGWLATVFCSLHRRRRHQDAMLDSMPSSDERILGELATLQVSLLRGNDQGYYEKVASVTRRIVRSKGFALPDDATNADLLDILRNGGADAAFLESVQSILSRCDAVLIQGIRFDHAAHEQIGREAKELLRMRGQGGPRQTHEARNEKD